MDILDVLELIKVRIEALNPVPEKFLISRGNANGFEELVPEIVDVLSKEIEPLEFDVHYGHHFPDMDLILHGKKYGLELKSRNNGSWDTNGNSVFESITDENYEEIYLLFGTHRKGTPRLQVKYRPYWQATAAITVTHSPRFKINMNATESVFESAAEYASLREMTEVEKIGFLQSYLKKNTAGAKWFVPQASGTVKPTPLNDLEPIAKAKVVCEAMIVYPQDLLRKSGKYTRSHEYFLLTYFYYSGSIRDFFSAGGRWDKNGIKLPQVMKRMHLSRDLLIEMLETANEEFKDLAYQSWSELDLKLPKKNFKRDYFTVIDYLGKREFHELLKSADISRLSEILGFSS